MNIFQYFNSDLLIKITYFIAQIRNMVAMKNLIIILATFLTPFCNYAQQTPWDQIITTYESELYIDSTQIKRSEGLVYARIKTIYTSPQAKESYVNKIKKVFSNNAEKKIKKWANFTYTITYGVYDCTNSRFKIIEVEDYDDNNKRIVKTKTKEDTAKWLNVELETMGDYIIFSICDYIN